MQITLKNGETIKLAWNWLVVERLEQEVGSLNNLNKKNVKQRGEARTMGDAVYAVVQANYSKEMPRNELLSLINYEDIERIGLFIEKNNQKDADSVDRKKTHPASKSRKK